MHLLTFVVVPEIKRAEILKFVFDQLAPYDANLVVEGPEGVYPVNADAEWDYWCVGGRYDGLVTGQRAVSENDEPAAIWARNTVKVADLPLDLVPAVIVTPDGKWHDWFKDVNEWRNMKRDDVDAKWNELARAILSQHRESYVVAVDCHGALLLFPISQPTSSKATAHGSHGHRSRKRLHVRRRLPPRISMIKRS